jgi:hypothetical protein
VGGLIFPNGFPRLFFLWLKTVVEDELKKYEVQPLAELISNLIEVAGILKTQLFVEVDTR